MPGKSKNPLARQNAQRAFAESSLVSQAANLVQVLIGRSKFKQKEIATKLGLSTGRVSQMRTDPGNMTLKSLAALCWSLGYRIELHPHAIQVDLRHQLGGGAELPPVQEKSWEVTPGIRRVAAKTKQFRPELVVLHDGSMERVS
jgi:DNA-binding Xre family transcriptional regulator